MLIYFFFVFNFFHEEVNMTELVLLYTFLFRYDGFRSSNMDAIKILNFIDF